MPSNLSHGPLLSVQYGRALAALAVIYAHLAGFEVFRNLDIPFFGGAGVDLFFVISGYVMWSTAQRYSSTDFMLRRVARIVPTYWFYTSALVVLALTIPQLAPRVHIDAMELAGSYFFVPYTNARGQANPILLQGWTLNFEMYFYALFAVALQLRPSRTRFFFLAGFIAASVTAGALIRPDNATLAMMGSAMLVEFLLGMGIAAAGSKWRPTNLSALTWALAGCGALIAAEIAYPDTTWRAVLYGLPAGSMLVGLLGLEPWLRRHPSRLLAGIGDSSYSLYLSHPFVLSAAAIVFRPIAGSEILVGHAAIAGAIFALTATAAACGVAWMSFNLLEQPTASWLLHWFHLSGERGGPSSPPLELVSSDQSPTHEGQIGAWKVKS